MHKEQGEQETLIGDDLLPYGHGNLTKNKTHTDAKNKTKQKWLKGASWRSGLRLMWTKNRRRQLYKMVTAKEINMDAAVPAVLSELDFHIKRRTKKSITINIERIKM